jgi:Fe2+ transport system protein B
LIITGILTVVFINFGIDISSNLSAYYHHGFLFFLYTCCFLIFYAIIVNLISGQSEIWLTRWIAWLGVNVTTAYVVQWLFIGNIATAVYKTQELLPLVFWFLAILLLTSAGIYLWKKVDLKFTI